MTSSEDGTIRLFDIREQESCTEVDCDKVIVMSVMLPVCYLCTTCVLPMCYLCTTCVLHVY